LKSERPAQSQDQLNLPAKDLQASSLCDTQARSQLQTDQQFPILDLYQRVKEECRWLL